jgi:hypothetical protein
VGQHSGQRAGQRVGECAGEHAGKRVGVQNITECRVHIMLRDLLTQKCVDKKNVTDSRYPRACRFRKYQIDIGPRATSTNFFQNMIFSS